MKLSRNFLKLAQSPLRNSPVRTLAYAANTNNRKIQTAISKKHSKAVRQLSTSFQKLSASGSVKTEDLNTLIAHLPAQSQEWINHWVSIAQPDRVELCDGSEAESKRLQQVLIDAKMLEKVPALENCFLACTDPKDVARVESKTVIATPERRTTIPDTAEGVDGKLGQWMEPEKLQTELDARFPGCMKGRTMYIIPFSMGPVGGPLSKEGIQLTDSAYVVLSMGTMARVSDQVIDVIKAKGGEFVKCMHSVGCPLPLERELTNHWPCNPEKVLVSHIPENNEIVSFGSGYGGNSLLGKKCFALRIGSAMAEREGWLAEHMLIAGITNPQGEKKYIAAAFPSACGKTNLAMMEPLLPGWKFECVGDDIAWMRFDDQGKLRAINPENGFFGVAPGTSMETNPNAMKCCEKDTIFTNVAKTSDGNVWWEGMPKVNDDVEITTWLGEKWDKKTGKAAHPNSRFCTPAANCPVMSDSWESPEGVPIDAIIFGGRRPEGVPLVYESYSWEHGVMIGAGMRSETTAAAEFKGKALMNDPMAMRPFFGYNFGKYLQHWLNINKEGRQMPGVFHVNWFRKDENGKFLWPGFGENVRVLEWIFDRCGDNQVKGNASETAIGYVPKQLNLEGLKENVDMDALMHLPKEFWEEEMADMRKYLNEQVGKDTPNEVLKQIEEQEKRIASM